MLQFSARASGHPKAQRRDDLAVLRAVEQIESDYARGHNANQSEEFAQSEIEQVHLSDGSCVYQWTKNRLVDGNGGRNTQVASMISFCNAPYVGCVFVER